MTTNGGELDVRRNPSADPEAPYGPEERSVVSLARHRRVRREIESWPGYRPTPLRRLDDLARRTGVAEVRVKDEGGRFGLGSFKALGGAYGVFRAVAEEVADRSGEEPPAADELVRGRTDPEVRKVTVTCATDGNHGRAVAWGAEIVGCRCVVYLPTHVTETREEAIASHGARVVRVDGDYDDAVARAERDAAARGWIVVSDTSYEGYDRIPRAIMQGYTVMVAEVLDKLGEDPLPTHVFLQGGVGGLAAAVAGHFWERFGPERPRMVVVEPEEADGLYRTAGAGELREASGSLETLMGGLACRAVSPVAWTILTRGADAFVRIPDGAAVEAMRVLARGEGGDPPVVAGESGAAGAGALLRIGSDPEARRLLALDAESRVLLFITEGATDPGRYRELVGTDPADVLAAGV